jgi:hypothetical protein
MFPVSVGVIRSSGWKVKYANIHHNVFIVQTKSLASLLKKE